MSGTVASAQAAFGVSLQSYTHDGQTVQAPSGDASVPNSVGNAILAVDGLDTTKNAAHVGAPIPPPPAFANARPCSIYYGQIAAKYQADFKTKLPKFQGATLPYAPCGYTGPQFRAAYENNSALDGSGITVASTLWYNSSTITSDINTYATNHGDGAYAPGQLKICLPKGGFNVVPECDPSGVQAEQALDTEAMHAMAPSANILYYAAASCFDNDLIDTLAKVVRQNGASIVSNSWGDLEETASQTRSSAYETIFLRGALQGISFLFSSGDNGDELANTGLKQTDYPTSIPTSRPSAARATRSAETVSSSSRPAGAPRSTPCPPTASRGPRSVSCTARVAASPSCSTVRATRTESCRRQRRPAGPCPTSGSTVIPRPAC